MELEIRDIFDIKDEKTFRACALEVFRFQAAHVPVYRDFLAALRVDPAGIREVEDIPFLPIEFFKSHRVLAEDLVAELVFESSGTTGMQTSRHPVARPELYRESFSRAFRLVHGDPARLCILALLPSYLERGNSSLVHMMDHLIQASDHPDSGFYLDRLDELAAKLERLDREGQPTLLIGVSFALLDLADAHPMALGEQVTIMETGGMKGRREELIRSELHDRLGKSFGKKHIHSEYGMTELFSQAYSKGEGVFGPPPWMKVLIRDPNDPLSLLGEGPSGGINVIDLANLDSCSFIATQDLGRLLPGDRFEVLGRFDHSDVRGCNLLVT